MAKLKDFWGRFCESDYEYAFLACLEKEGWLYALGTQIGRETKRDVLIENDFKTFITDINPGLEEDDVNQLFDNVRLIGSSSEFSTLHKFYGNSKG